MRNLLKERLTKDNFIQNLFAVPVLIYTVYLLTSICITTFSGTAFPNEFREAANVWMTKAIMAGENPYSLSALQGEVPSTFYLYGPLFSIITAAIGSILPVPIVALHYAISLLAVLCSAFLVSRMVYEHSRTLTAPLLAFLFTIMCHWRYGYIYAAPDSLGLFVLILILFVLTRKRFRYQALLCAVLTWCAFFTKQYFVMIAGTVFVYFFFLSKKEALRYSVDMILLAIGLGALIAWKFPLFWTYAIYFVKGPGAGVSTGSAGVSHNTSQVSYLGGMFLCLFVVGAFDFIRTVVVRRSYRLRFRWKQMEEPFVAIEQREGKHVDEKRSPSFEILFWGQMLLAAICLQYLGKNDGAWISYYLQLFMPGLIVVSLIAIDNYSYKKIWNYLYLLCYGVMILITIQKTDKRLIVNHMDSKELSYWEEAYEILDEHAVEEIFYVPVLAYQSLDKGQFIYNTGQPFVITEHYLKEYNGDVPMQKLFPHAGKIMEQHLKCREEIRQKVRNGSYGVVTNLPDNDVIFTEEDLSLHYKKKTTIPLKTGNWTYEIDFWERAE